MLIPHSSLVIRGAGAWGGGVRPGEASFSCAAAGATPSAASAAAVEMRRPIMPRPGTPKAGPYRVSINYYSQGPMGYGMGLLSIQRFDGKGGLAFEDRPYVIMNDHAYVDLGTVR